MNSKFLFSLVLFLQILSLTISGQEIIYSNDEGAINYPNQEKEKIVNDKLYPHNNNNNNNSKVSYQIDLGSSFSASKTFGNALSFYTAPQIKYKFTPKLNLSAGIMLINTSVSNYYLAEKHKNSNINQAFLFSGFDYQATEKLKIYGQIMYGLNSSPNTMLNNNSQYFLRFDAEYKVTENFSIGLRIMNQNMGYPGYGNYGVDPFNNYNSFYNPINR
jgi:hypothetical protein